MGLTIHYSLRLATRSAAVAERTVRELHAAATRLGKRRGLGKVGLVIPMPEASMHSSRYVMVRRRGYSDALDVEPTAGWCFTVDIGEGCEPATFGLGLYPAFVADGARRRRTGFGGAWTFGAFCKTQYASCAGADHLVRCHAAVIDLILLWKKAGAQITISDEAEYWPGRDPRLLLERTESLNQFVAALAGATKDASEAAGGPPVQSPIFAHPRFEHIEAEGVAQHGDILAAITRKSAAKPDPQ
jgi:hypothetical protein